MDKSYRIHTNIAQDTLLQVNMEQDFDFLEVLSLKLRQKDAYRLHSSNYGIIVGRVLANDAFGIPNAKLSIFIERDESDSSDMEHIYPYSEVTSKDKEGRRYNLLPDYSDDECYRVVGTFPNKRLMLDDDVQLEIYDKYWKYTTVTNNSGDYMLYGVPTGSVTVHVDIDLSDIGILSQKPRDFEYKGYNVTMFDSPTQFKESTNLDGLAQLISQNRSVFVYPFWGDEDNGIASITRADIQVQYKFEPTCVFMGSIVSDNEGHAIGHKCAPDVENGMNNQLVGGNGTIEMIRKTTDGLIEEYQIQGNQLIDENGVWCYQIPMNLDYIGTDEYGNIVPTDNPNKGIPTRTQVRFRISKNESADEGFSKHTAKYLVPMNPMFSEKDEDEDVRPKIPYDGKEVEKMYSFGSSTPISCFRDLYWNNVYSVKNYIPKTQTANKAHTKNYNALKGANLADDQNPIPFNKIRIQLPFAYLVTCLVYQMIIAISCFLNMTFICIVSTIITAINLVIGFKLPLIGRVFKFIPLIKPIGCITLNAGTEEGNIAYYPCCRYCPPAKKAADCPREMDGCELRDDNGELLDKIQRNLAQEYKIVKLDLYQDWLNGCLYMPLWYWKKQRKKTFLFGLFTLSRAKNEYCSDNPIRAYKKLRTAVTCNITYLNNALKVSNNKKSMPDSENKWHRDKKGVVGYKRGLIKPVENKDGLTAYYYVALQATSDNDESYEEMAKRKSGFYAIRLFATDIILLGNLDPNNIYGIPQFFNCLPSTTSNVPPIGTVQETDNETASNSDGGDEESGSTLTTGMDWGRNGDKDLPKYKSGLFMDLSCTQIKTKPKTCINAERLSELGVYLDTKHNVAYDDGGNDIKYGEMDADGFISKLELDDSENRAMFATLNHIGFIPQEYQDSIGGYTTQVLDRNTNYLIPKFKYIYPIDFDGRLQVPMNNYRASNGKRFAQAMDDENDNAYLTFRFGAERTLQGNNEIGGRLRHFYHKNGDYLDMPLYNNSYYFYFGIKKGNTAIDKFNKLFYSPCITNKKFPFTLDVTTQGRSYCPEVYDDIPPTHQENPERYADASNKNNAYGWIRVESDDVRTPYSYTLYDSFDNVIVSEDNMTASTFVIGGVVNPSKGVTCNIYGEIYYQIPNDSDEYEGIGKHLENKEYILEVVDADGRRVAQKVRLEMPKISAEYTATALGTKFYNSATTRMDYICHDDTSFYGKIEMDKFFVDSYTCNITDVEFLRYDNSWVDESGNTQHDDIFGRYVFCVTGSSSDISNNVTAILELSVLNTTNENLVKNCLCDDNEGEARNLIKVAQDAEATVNMHIDEANRKPYFLGFDEANKIITWYFYQPNQYVMKITQGCVGCGNPSDKNTTSEIVNIENGESFKTYLNQMPTRFMLGTNDDAADSDIANKSFFYRNNVVTGASDYNIKGWYGLHQEDTYAFSKRKENKTYNYNQSMWSDFVDDISDDVAEPESKRSILKFKFNTMFDLCKNAYITQDSNDMISFNAVGGAQPILYRSVIPMYEDGEKFKRFYVLEDSFMSICTKVYPNIVSKNYSLEGKNTFEYPINSGETLSGGPEFNKSAYENETKLGNYFAAFTRNGGYVSDSKINGNIKIERSPSQTSVSPIKGNVLKTIGKDVINVIDAFELVHTRGEQTLSGDKERDVKPYLRAMYVDRRLDYDLTIFAPIIGSNRGLYYVASGDTKQDKNRIYTSGRVRGWIYNGIEMSYDESYNVISANVYSSCSETEIVGEGESASAVCIDHEYTSAEFNKRLEYTYKYDCAHKCLNCGYEWRNLEGKSIKLEDECPKCHSDAISHFHGEIGTPVSASVVDGVAYYEMGEHKQDTVNFGENDEITGFISGNNETHYTLDDAITYYHKWSGDTAADWGLGEPKWGKWNSIEVEVLSGNGTSVSSVTETFGFDKKADEGYEYNNSGELVDISGQKVNYDGNLIDNNGKELTDDDGNPIRGNLPELSNIPLIKEYYASSINGMDIRNMYWSQFNFDRLNYYANSNKPHQQKDGHGVNAIQNTISPFYVYQYPYKYAYTGGTASNKEWYNGDFNRDDAVAYQTTASASTSYGRNCTIPNHKQYPTKRYIDIGNLPQETSYNYQIQSCSYDMNASKTTEGEILAQTIGGEAIDITLDWSSPITIVPPNSSNNSYANITYTPDNNVIGSGDFKGYLKFTSKVGAINFKYNSRSCDGFDVYTQVPRLIQVLPYPKINNKSRDIDGIGLLKTSNLEKEFGGEGEKKYGDGLELDDIISALTLTNGIFDKTELDRVTYAYKVVSLPNGVRVNEGFTTKYGSKIKNGKFFMKDDGWLSSDDEDFTNITFSNNTLILKNNNREDVSVFAILVQREYVNDENDNLLKHIRTFETSELFDCRDIYVKASESGNVWTSSEETSMSAEVLSYVTYSIGNEEETEEGSDPLVETSLYQTLCFEIKYKTSDSGGKVSEQNMAFDAYDSMTYIFKFLSITGEKYDITCDNVTRIEDIETSGYTNIRMQVQWPSSMGILADSQWSGKLNNHEGTSNIQVDLFAKTSSDFVYKLSNFRIHMNGQVCDNSGTLGESASSIRSSIKTDAGQDDGKTYKTLVGIKK